MSLRNLCMFVVEVVGYLPARLVGGDISNVTALFDKGI